MNGLKYIVASLMAILFVISFAPTLVFAEGEPVIDNALKIIGEDTGKDAGDIQELEKLDNLDDKTITESVQILGTDNVNRSGDNVIQITTIQDLDNIRNAPDEDYILMSDLDLSSATSEGGVFYNEGKGWNPIGSTEPTFSGSFDGNGHVIKGLYSKGTSGSNGLFGINDGVIANLEIQSSKLEGTSGMIGSIAGANNGIIENCVVTSTINSTENMKQKKVGGITGINLNEVNNCVFDGTITISGSCEEVATAGGIIGYSEGDVSGNTNNGTIKCNLTQAGSAYAGGISGMCTVGELADNINKGTVNATTVNDDANAGGIAGISLESAIRNVNYGSVTAFSQSDETYSGGIIGFNKGEIDICINKGNVAADNNNEDKKVCCGGVAGYTAPGDEEGNINTCCNQGTVKANGKSGIWVGGVVGHIESAAIQYSYNSGSVEGSVRLNNFSNQTSCGGLAGRVNQEAAIVYCYNTGSIVANGFDYSYASAGGIAGTQWDGAISECYNSGDIRGKLRAGGICAENYSYILNCYNAGTITGVAGADYVGGIVGGNFSDSALALVYNVGKVNGGYEKGGIVGFHAEGSATLIDDTVFTIDYAGPATLIYNPSSSSYIPLGKTCTSNEMTKPSTFNSFDFDSVWKMGSGKYKYPILMNILSVEQQNSIDLCKNGHTWDSGIITKIATCPAKGTKTFTCKVCGNTRSESVTNHKFVWVTKVPAGLLKNGSKILKCVGCGKYSATSVIPGWAKSYVKSLKVGKGKKSITVKWKKQSKANQKKFNGYQIRYSTKSSMAGAKMTTAKKSASSKTIKKLKKKTKYYVQVRTYTKKAGKKFYSKWSSKKSVKTR